VLAIHAALPDAPTPRPPIVLVHGAANSAIVWTLWQRELAARRWPSYAIELRGHGSSTPCDLSSTSMSDYAADVCVAIDQLRQPCTLMGWSMGGLVAMMAAARRPDRAIAVIGLAPSTPASDAAPNAAALRTGEFGPEEDGITSDDPDAQSVMPDLDREERLIALASLGRESRYARDERAAGIPIAGLPCPLLIATGSADAQWPRSRYEGLPLSAQFVEAEGASHWGLVLSRSAVTSLAPVIDRWLGQQLRSSA
jgi:pimeloyl-ACP methyl ester carboxylesterase